MAKSLANSLAINNSKPLKTEEMNSLYNELLKCKAPNLCPSGKSIIKNFKIEDLKNIFKMNISSFRELPDVIKNILIINCLLYLATITLESQGINLTKILGLHQFQSPNFRPHQLITHMFMHGSFTHLFINMFAVWMIGKVLENIWGGKRFLKFYIITGLGAALIYIGYIQFQINAFSKNIDPSLLQELLYEVKNRGADVISQGQNYTNPILAEINGLINAPMVGASGALFGILLAFGMLFPNTLFYIYFAIPIKAKYFVILYGAIELFLGFKNLPGDNIAHFAHLGGMIAGYILLKYWKQDRNTFY